MDKYMIDGHKIMWHLDRVHEAKAGKAISPIYVEVSPTSLCNHRCIFCGIDFARDKGSQLKTDILNTRLQEMGSLGVRSVMFAGEGEPLLHKDTPLFIKTARESGMDVSMTTNGSFGGDALWQDTLRYLQWIRFSVDAGDAKTYAEVHRVSLDSFDKVVKNIELAVKVKLDRSLPVTVGIQFLVIEENLPSIEKAIRLFSGIGVDYFSLKPYSLHPQMVNKKETFYTDETVQYIRGAISKEAGRPGMSIIFRDESMTKYIEKSKNFCHCRALPYWGYISSKGDFYTCSIFIGDERFRAGNIYDEDMRAILFGAKRKASIEFAGREMDIDKECRLNCRMARANEFLEFLDKKPEHANFV